MLHWIEGHIIIAGIVALYSLSAILFAVEIKRAPMTED